MNPFFFFEIIHQSKRSNARTGRIHTPHGIIETPNFVPVATHATLKTIDSVLADPLQIQLLFCNTYHLILHPGPDTVEKMGGLHRFMRRNAPIITDSGGFQVFSLAYGSVKDELKSRGKKKQDGSLLKVTEEGVLFRSYRDGQKVLLTPESSVMAQKQLGSDIIIPLDELPPYHIDERALRRSFDRTHRWQKRSLQTHLANPKEQAMYAVVHGGVNPALRKESCDILSAEHFDGFAVGGSLGKTRPEMISMLKEMMPHLPDPAPRHLLGIGDLPSVQDAVPLGFDTFDSSYPTKCARHGILLDGEKSVNITQTIYHDDPRAPCENCQCHCCKHYSRSYLHHLFKAHEQTAHTLASLHNLHFMMQWMKRFREQILRDEI